MNLSNISRQGLFHFRKFLKPLPGGIKKDLFFCCSLTTTSNKFDEMKANDNDKLQEKISRYPVNNIKDLPLHVQERMYGLYDKAGFVPNLFHALAHRPGEFKCFLDYYDALTNRENSNLTRSDQEMIGIVVSSLNGCAYCVMAHSALHRITSGNPYLADQLATNYRTANLTKRNQAILSLAVAITTNESVEDKHFTDLAEFGLNREDAWDVAAFTSLTSLINRMSVFLDIKPNPEFYTMGRKIKNND